MVSLLYKGDTIMLVLTEENKPYSMNEVDENTDIFFGIIDYSDPRTADYLFYPLMSTDVYRTPAIELLIGNDKVVLPMDWNIVIGDKDSGEIEVFPIKKLIDRSFSAFIMNPISGYMPEFKEIHVLNIFPDLKWNLPTLLNGYILCVPIKNVEKPKCIFISSPTVKVPDVLDINDLI